MMQLKMVKRTYTRIHWVNPETGKHFSQIFDQDENEALTELKDGLALNEIEWDEDILRPM